MSNERIDSVNILLLIFGVLFMLGDAIFAFYLYHWFSDDVLLGNGAVLGIFVSLVAIGVLIPSILFTIAIKRMKR